MRTLKSSILSVIISLGLATLSQAKLIEIQFTGLDFKYDGIDVFDAGNKAGGNGDTAESDPLTTMTFLTDSTLEGVLTTNIHADFILKGVTNIPAAGGLVMATGASGFGFDLLVKTGTSAWGLGLDVDGFQVFYSGNQLSIAATELASNLRIQDLPFGLEISPTDEIKIIISSANLSEVTEAGGFLTGFKASGTGNIRGHSVPEPVLAGLGLLTFVGMVLSNRNRS
ncbi:MAG: hypothetical protein O2931_05925 [Planctomycetota bacterium]|nr:hypothetical protein [Planctomycetota bacterium]MDA1178322.1 hypothetical protein [Planctomycetota bacterium]